MNLIPKAQLSNRLHDWEMRSRTFKWDQETHEQEFNKIITGMGSKMTNYLTGFAEGFREFVNHRIYNSLVWYLKQDNLGFFWIVTETSSCKLPFVFDYKHLQKQIKQGKITGQETSTWKGVYVWIGDYEHQDEFKFFIND